MQSSNSFERQPSLSSSSTLSSHPFPYSVPDIFQVHELKKAEGIYEGELRNYLRHGQGVFMWQNGDIYFGNHFLFERVLTFLQVPGLMIKCMEKESFATIQDIT